MRDLFNSVFASIFDALDSIITFVLDNWQYVLLVLIVGVLMYEFFSFAGAYNDRLMNSANIIAP